MESAFKVGVLRMSRATGRVGYPADGWVEWTTEDHGMSYNPSIGYGERVFVLSREENGWELLFDSYHLDDPEEGKDYGTLGYVRSVSDLLNKIHNFITTDPNANKVWILEGAMRLWKALVAQGRHV